MKEKELLELWQKGDHFLRNGQISPEQIGRLLKPRASRLSFSIKFQLIFYILVQLVCIFLLSLNVYGYRGNFTMQSVSSILIALCLIFLLAGGNLFRSFKKINKKNGDILSSLKNRILFFCHTFERWNVITAATAWILFFALSTYVDNVDGVFRINRPFFFIVISIAMMVFIYAVNKSAAGMTLKEIRVCLRELENAWEGTEESLARIKKRQIKFLMISMVILTIFFIIGLLVFLSRS